MNLYGGNIAILGASLWRLRREPAPAELGAMLARQGIDWGRLAVSGSLRDFALGMRRCSACRAKDSAPTPGSSNA
jgi:hypothetical protein